MSSELFTRTRAVGRAGDLWFYVSASRLNLWLKCQLAFQLCCVEGSKASSGRPSSSASECMRLWRAISSMVYLLELRVSHHALPALVRPGEVRNVGVLL